MTEIRLKWLNKTTNICLRVIMRNLIQGGICTFTLKMQTVLWFQKILLCICLHGICFCIGKYKTFLVNKDRSQQIHKYWESSEIFGKRSSFETSVYSCYHRLWHYIFYVFCWKVKVLKKCMKQVQNVSVSYGFRETLTAYYKSQKVSTFCYVGLDI